MSVDVAPVTGKTPEWVAKELRVLLKEMWQEVAEGGGEAPVAYNVERLNKELAKAREFNEQTRVVISRLTDAAPLRRAKLTLELAQELHGLYKSERHALDNLAYFKDQVVGGGHAWKKGLERAYALVQALPTVPNVPVGKAENTIRAVAAIVKAHYGLLDGDIKPVPLAGAQEQIEEVLLQLVQAVKSDLLPNTALINAGLSASATDDPDAEDYDEDEETF